MKGGSDTKQVKWPHDQTETACITHSPGTVEFPESKTVEIQYVIIVIGFVMIYIFIEPDCMDAKSGPKIEQVTVVERA